MSEATEKAEALISAMLRAAIEEFDSTSGTQYEARFRRDMVAARGALIELVAKLERERDEALARLASIAMERDAAQRELDLFGIENAGHWRDVGDIIKVAIENATFPLEERIRHLEERERTLLPKAERCDRYEAPGPALLTQEQIDAVSASDWDDYLSLVHELLAAQHARDVAIVEAVNDESIAIAILTTINRESAGEAVRAAILRALKGET